MLVSFADHPDTVGGCKISADWPGFVRRTVEKVLDNTKCIFFNGKQGYFPMREAYDEGGYETGSSNFRAGVAEQIIAEGKALRKELIR